MKHVILSLGILLGIAFSASAGNTKLLRFPDIHGDQIVFSYAGDLYLTTTSGGVARKITNDEGYEMFPKFSLTENTLHLLRNTMETQKFI